MRLGKMPTILKRRIFKNVYNGKGSKTNPDNYRPISIISATSKLHEKIVYNKLSEYTENNNLINEDQHGYRIHRSTQTATSSVINMINDTIDKGQIVGIIIFDFVKHLI